MGDHDILLKIDDEIIIRRYRDEDAAPISKRLSNPNVWNQLSDRIPHPCPVEDVRAYIAQVRAPENQAVTGPSLEDANAPRVPKVYVIAVDGEPAGIISLDFNSGIWRLNAMLGYWLGEDFQGRGIMSRITPAFVDWAWKTFVYLNRLNGMAYEHNIKSVRCMQKAGFYLESTRINGAIKNGVVCNEVVLAALRPDGL